MVTETDRNKARSAVVSAYNALDCVGMPVPFLYALADAAVDAVSTDAEPVKTAPAVAVKARKPKLPPIENELYEFYPSMSAQTHADAVKDYARAAVSAALSAQVQDVAGWQPIETAPVNGPNFIAWVIDLIDEYDENDRLIQRGKRVGSAVVAQCVSFTGGKGEVVEVPWKFVTCRRYTHWMPLPASPASKHGDAE